MEPRVISTSEKCEVCQVKVIEKYEHKPGLPPLCEKHLDMLKLILWVLPRIKMQQKVEAPKIFIPNGRGN